jgi:hypothetical protein
MRLVTLSAVLFLAIPAFGREHHWKQGTVLAIEDVGWSHHSSIVKYRIAGGSTVYEGRIIYTGGRIKGIRVRGTVDYDMDKGHLYLRDSRGKSHTLVLVRTQRESAAAH